MTTTRQIAFIDPSIADWETLVAGLGEGVEWILLEPGSDGLWQMANVLRGQTDVSAIHVFSHGSSGELVLGDAVVNTGNLEQYNEALATIGNVLTETGDILLYGCNVAEGDGGQAFITQLAAYTGADVAASTNLTGNAALGGDWVLESSTGTIDNEPLLETNLQATYAGLLAAIVGTGSSEILNGTSGDDTIDGRGGDDTRWRRRHRHGDLSRITPISRSWLSAA